MERIEEMLSYIEEDIKEAVIAHQEWLETGDFPKLEEIIQWVKQELKSLEKDCFVISFLRSSYITGSHKFKLAVFEGEPFIERNPLHQMASLDYLYQESNQELAKLTKKLKGKFINITAAELELIRQFYMGELYQSSKVLFARIVKKVSENTGKTKVFFGEEMGEIEEIGVF